ncbi:ATP-binding cassette sub- B member 6, mitochondrial [Ancistrocladus abbreviatus]
MLRNEVGWFDEEENSADTLSMRLANDATFVRAAFSNRLSIFIQDSAAVFVAILIGMLLQWRLALVALGTLPVLTISAVAQKLWLAGFSRGIQEMHRKASLVLEDAVRNIYTVVAFCVGNKVMELYRLQLKTILMKSFLHGMAIGFCFGFSQFLLFACNALLLWYTAVSVKNHYMDLPTALKEYIVFSFATFALVEPFVEYDMILVARWKINHPFLQIKDLCFRYCCFRLLVWTLAQSLYPLQEVHGTLPLREQQRLSHIWLEQAPMAELKILKRGNSTTSIL